METNTDHFNPLALRVRGNNVHKWSFPLRSINFTVSTLHVCSNHLIARANDHNYTSCAAPPLFIIQRP